METFKQFAEETVTNIFIFLSFFIISSGTCAHKTVTCASGQKTEVRAP